VQVASVMAKSPDRSLPKQCAGWGDLKAAYRLLSNERVDPQAIQQPHRQQTLAECENRGTILCVQDDSVLSFNNRTKVKGLGRINDQGRGLVQHSTLAVTPTGELLGLLDEFWFLRVEAEPGETRRERDARWRESKVWSEAVNHVGRSPSGCRLVHVMDRAGDTLETMAACREQEVGFVIRAFHNRRVEGGGHLLWPWMKQKPKTGTMTVTLGAQRDPQGRVVRRKRQAKVSIRFSKVRLEPSWNHPGPKEAQEVWAVYLREKRPPKDAEPVDWMLLTSEPVETLADARRIITWYQHRWVIEEWHRVLKEGCRLESSQLDEVGDLERLAAIQSVVAVRLLQLRDLAGMATTEAKNNNNEEERDPAPTAESPAALQGAVPWSWIEMVSWLAKVEPSTLTPRQFWLSIARRGGWLGRKHDHRPGWKVIWRGWSDIHLLVEGVQLQSAARNRAKKCG
jgi:hypothetical protein